MNAVYKSLGLLTYIMTAENYTEQTEDLLEENLFDRQVRTNIETIKATASLDTPLYYIIDDIDDGYKGRGKQIDIYTADTHDDHVAQITATLSYDREIETDITRHNTAYDRAISIIETALDHDTLTWHQMDDTLL